MEGEQIKQELDAMQTRLNELRQIVESPQKARKRIVFDLKSGDDCWSIVDGKPFNVLFESWFISRRYLGLIFLTKEECQKALDMMRAKTLWKKTMAELNDGWEPDCSEKGQRKYYYFYVHQKDGLIFDHQTICKSHKNGMYARSLEILEKARELLGDEVTRLAWIGE